jgi:hypothetical protein
MQKKSQFPRPTPSNAPRNGSCPPTNHYVPRHINNRYMNSYYFSYSWWRERDEVGRHLCRAAPERWARQSAWVSILSGSPQLNSTHVLQSSCFSYSSQVKSYRVQVIQDFFFSKTLYTVSYRKKHRCKRQSEWFLKNRKDFLQHSCKQESNL